MLSAPLGGSYWFGGLEACSDWHLAFTFYRNLMNLVLLEAAPSCGSPDCKSVGNNEEDRQEKQDSETGFKYPLKFELFWS